METTLSRNTQTRGKDRKVSAVPSPATSTMLIEPNLSRDSSRALTCLVEGEASLFSVVAPGGMSIRSFKNLIHKTNPDLARNLRLLKVDVDLKYHDDDSLRELTFTEDVGGVEKLIDWKTVSDVWPDQPAFDRLHVSITLLSSDPWSLKKRHLCSPPPHPPPNTSPRNDTVSGLYQRVMTYSFVEVRGTPASGKTVLAQLLAQYVLRRDPDLNVICVNGWPLEEVEDSGGHLGYLQKKGWVPGRNTLFIFDDAQMTYKDMDLWGIFFKSIHEYKKRRAIVFTGYGSPKSWIHNPGVRIKWNDSQKVNLHPVYHGDHIPPVGLFLSRKEFNNLISRHYPNPEYHFHLSFFDSVFDLTEGHVGAILALMMVITAHDSYHKLKFSGQWYTWNTFLETIGLCNLFEQLSPVFKQGLPEDMDLQVLSVRHIFSAVLCKNVVIKSDFTCEADQDALQQCYHNGWLHSDLLHDTGEVCYIFASLFHHWFVEWKFVNTIL